MKICLVFLIFYFPMSYISAADYHVKTDDSVILSYVIEPICSDDNLDNSITQKYKDDNTSLIIPFDLNTNYCVFCLSPTLNCFINKSDILKTPPPP